MKSYQSMINRLSGILSKDSLTYEDSVIIGDNSSGKSDILKVLIQSDEVEKYYFIDAVNRYFNVNQIINRSEPEIIYSKADHTKDHMGLTTWKNAPDGRVLKSDVTIAKNYLNEKQIRQLERAVSGYFDYIEDLIERENTFTMEEFAQSINEFLAFRRYDILPDNGKISSKSAKEKAEQEYKEFNKTQKIISDFDKEVQKMLNKH